MKSSRTCMFAFAHKLSWISSRWSSNISRFQISIKSRFEIFTKSIKTHTSLTSTRMPNALSNTPRLDKKTFCYETCGSNLFMRINRAAGEPIFIHSPFTRAIRLLDKFLWKPQTSFLAISHYLHSGIWNSNQSRAKPRARFRGVQECLVGLFRTRKLFNFFFKVSFTLT